MNISLDNIGNVSRAMPPLFAADASVAPSAAKRAEGWKTHEVGASELAQVAGEEAIDEAELRRDDPLGNLVSRAFDPMIAAAALPPLSIL